MSNTTNFQDIYGECNNAVCDIPSTTILYPRSVVSSHLLSAATLSQPVVNQKSSTSNAAGINYGDTLMGYYIKPVFGLNNAFNKLQFSPVVQSLSGTTLTTKVLKEIILPMDKCYVGDSSQTSLVSGMATFEHSSLQFHGEAASSNFELAYIDYFTIRCIVESCDYLAISGALVLSGNLEAVPWNDPNHPDATAAPNCNKGYFTYKIMGLNASTNNTIPAFPPTSPTSIPAIPGALPIPTAGWAMPCPPMWKPV